MLLHTQGTYHLFDTSSIQARKKKWIQGPWKKYDELSLLLMFSSTPPWHFTALPAQHSSHGSRYGCLSLHLLVSQNLGNASTHPWTPKENFMEMLEQLQSSWGWDGHWPAGDAKCRCRAAFLPGSSSHCPRLTSLPHETLGPRNHQLV